MSDSDGKISGSVVDGAVYGSRWVNKDGTLKTGKDLEEEKIRVELEDIARRLLRLANGVSNL